MFIRILTTEVGPLAIHVVNVVWLIRKLNMEWIYEPMFRKLFGLDRLATAYSGGRRREICS